MAIKIIDPFTNIELTPIETTDQSGDATFLSNLRAVNIGDGGNNVFRADKDGIWLGAKTFAAAPFRVSMAGAITASSITITGGTLKYGKTGFTDSVHDGYYFGIEGLYAGKAADATLFKFTMSSGALEYGGKVVAGTGSNIAAGYISGSITASQIGSVNASAITGGITSGQITSVNASAISGYITSSQISSVNASAISGYITASQISSVNASAISGTITAGQIASITAGQITGTISSGQIASITAGQITGTISYSQIGSVNANTITINQLSDSQISGLSASKLTAGTINAAIITVTNLNASNITSGTLYVGGSSQPAAIVIARSSSGYNDAKLQWEGGCRMWADTSNYIGLNAIGGRIYFYTASNQYALFQDYAQAVFFTGISCRGALNVGLSGSTQDARFTGRLKLQTTGETQYLDFTSSQIRLWTPDQIEIYQNNVIKHILDNNFWTAGNVYGAAKFFNIPHPDGSARRLQYTSQESPDVVLRFRGRAEIGSAGDCEIVPAKHFSLVTEKKGETTINLTATEKNQDLYVGEISNEKVVVNGKPNSAFMYELMAVRKGYLNSPVEIDNDKDPVMIKVAEANARGEQSRTDYDARAKKAKEDKQAVA